METQIGSFQLPHIAFFKAVLMLENGIVILSSRAAEELFSQMPSLRLEPSVLALSRYHLWFHKIVSDVSSKLEKMMGPCDQYVSEFKWNHLKPEKND